MGFFSGLADFIDYMMFGEDSNSAARSREQRAEYERKAQERYEREQAAKQAKKKGRFTSPQKDGTTLYGPRETENRPGHRHGHRGENFDRSPHSTIGSAALGDAHTYSEHKNERTKRW